MSTIDDGRCPICECMMVCSKDDYDDVYCQKCYQISEASPKKLLAEIRRRIEAGEMEGRKMWTHETPGGSFSIKFLGDCVERYLVIPLSDQLETTE